MICSIAKIFHWSPWGSEVVCAKVGHGQLHMGKWGRDQKDSYLGCRILVRTQTLVKSAIVQVDAAPFKQWYLQHYGVDIGRKKKTAASAKK